MVKVKICGITNEEDAATAAALGAHAIGFIFASSPRRVTPEQARRIAGVVPPSVKKVGVFVNHDPAEIRQISGLCGLDLIQLHGDESPDDCASFTTRTIKTFWIEKESDLEAVEPYRGRIAAVLLDSRTGGIRGGTGRTFDWRAAALCGRYGLPVILAGGLTPENVQIAISQARPYAVDLNSGVEIRPGKKDPLLMREAMKRVMTLEPGTEDADEGLFRMRAGCRLKTT